MTRTDRILADILRVDHAGEYGAIRIYQAQLWAARTRAPDLVPALRGILAHELRHRDQFSALMRDRRVTPCHVLALWGLGGSALGLFTGLLGRRAVLTCTAAVERTVHRHLDDQLRWLGEAQPEVSRTIAAIQAEEQGHLAWAEHDGARRDPLDGLIVLATELLIFISTYGASARMARAVR